MIILIAKLAVHQSSSVILDDFAERIVYRLLQKNVISLPGKCTDGCCDCKDNPWGFYQPTGIYFPAEVIPIPVGNCAKIIFLSLAVAKDSMFYGVFQLF